ncbi:MAG: glycosyltransferase [Lentisphaeria bacterium]|nr:glycosyltransferase [Lentisphaeria bacterium]
MIDQLTWFFSDLSEYLALQFSIREPIDWVLMFFPTVLMFELPRYFFSGVLTYFLDKFGVGHDDEEAKRLFLATEPFVSIIVAGRNESEIISSTIESLLNLPYKNKEIIVIDDASDDNMYAICKKYADKGLIRLFGNFSETGRAGRPPSTNYGIRVSRGEFIISVDADTSYDYDTIQQMIGPFYNPKVGVVGGNIKARNRGATIWADLQSIEYMISIGLWKRWTNILGVTLQASGAFGAFRREVIDDFGGWDPELAEDADISLKARKCGWQIGFAPDAVAMTNVPENLWTLIKQRIRWDKGTVRTYFHKHKNVFNVKRFGFKVAFEVLQEYLMVYVLNLLYPIFVVYMLVRDYKLLIFSYIVAYILYVSTTFITFLIALSFSERRDEEFGLIWYTPFYPFYKEIFRWVRLYANILETFRWKYEESYIPNSGYRDKEKW